MGLPEISEGGEEDDVLKYTISSSRNSLAPGLPLDSPTDTGYGSADGTTGEGSSHNLRGEGAGSPVVTPEMLDQKGHEVRVLEQRLSEVVRGNRANEVTISHLKSKLIGLLELEARLADVDAIGNPFIFILLCERVFSSSPSTIMWFTILFFCMAARSSLSLFKRNVIHFNNIIKYYCYRRQTDNPLRIHQE